MSVDGEASVTVGGLATVVGGSAVAAQPGVSRVVLTDEAAATAS